MDEARHLRRNLIRFLERVQNATSNRSEKGENEGTEEIESHHSRGPLSWGAHEATLVTAHADANATVVSSSFVRNFGPTDFRCQSPLS